MSRRTQTITIMRPGRDQGKIFVLTEMSAMDAEDWAARAMLALVRNGGAQVPDEYRGQGLAGLAAMGIGAIGGIQYAELKPLMVEMLDKCVAYQTSPQILRPLIGQDDIEEVVTLLDLRRAVLELHLGFSLGSVLSVLRGDRGLTGADTPNTPTSPQPSAG